MPTHGNAVSYSGSPIAIRPEYVTSRTTTLRVREVEDLVFNRDFSVIKEDGSILMEITGKTISRNLKRQFTNSSGLPLFELRRNHQMKYEDAWSLAMPGAHTHDSLLSVNFKVFWMHAKIDILFRNLAPPPAENAGSYSDHVTLEVRGQDFANTTAHVTCGSSKVMHIRRETDDVDQRAAYKNAYGHRMGWQVTVAEGVDLALAAVIVVVLTELRG